MGHCVFAILPVSGCLSVASWHCQWHVVHKTRADDDATIIAAVTMKRAAVIEEEEQGVEGGEVAH